MKSDISIAWALTFLGTVSSRSWLYAYIHVNPKLKLKQDDKNRILVIGGAGYIGSSLVEKLLKRQHKVRILDIFLFGKEPIAHLLDDDNLEIIEGDFRKIDDLVIAIKNCSTVIHLGGIVGDPACSVDEDLTIEVNLTSTKIIGQIAKAEGVNKFIFASSCSVYGAQDSLLDENSMTIPLSLYARTKIASEHILSEMSNHEFSPIFLRFGTVYGFSGRTRFDLVANLLTADAYTKKKMTVFGKDQIRPFVHVSDAAHSIISALETKLTSVSNHDLIFNVGSNDQNYTLMQLAKMIQKQIPDAEIITESPDGDARNYNVSFDKSSTILNFKAKWSLEDGIKQVIQKFESGEIQDYSKAKYSNVKHLHDQGLAALSPLEFASWEQAFLEETYG